MRGVGPAGSWFIALKDRGRRMVVRIGGRRRVGGRMLMRKDCGWVSIGGTLEGWEGYSEFAGAPEALNDADMVDCHCGEEELGGVGVAGLW